MGTKTVSDNRDDFLNQLDSYMVSVEQEKLQAEQSDWSKAAISGLYQEIQQLSETSGHFDLPGFHEAAFSMEIYLSSFVDSAKSPSAKQQTEISHLFNALRETAQETLNEYGIDTGPMETEEQSADPLPDLDTKPIYALGPGGGSDAGITRRLNNLGLKTRAFENQDHLLQALEDEEPRAIVIDTVMLPDIEALIEQVALFRNQSHNTHLSVVFVSGTDSIDLRVAAIRAGADAFFAEPIDHIEVTSRILEMSQTHRQAQKRVLIVEDDPTQAEFAASILGKDGILTSIQTDPHNTLQTLEKFRPDLILMDIYMPEVNGIELTSIIRDHNEFMNIPIVFLSGEQDDDKQMDALSVGGDDFVTKPIRPRHLLNVVKHRIKRAHSLQMRQSPQELYQSAAGLVSHEIFLKRVAAALESDSSRQVVVVQVRPDGFDALSKDAFEPIMGSIAELSTAFIGPQELITISRGHSLLLYLHRNTVEQSINEIENIRSRFEQSDFSASGKNGITLSFGLSIADENTKEPHGLISRAEKACTIAQEQGGNQLKLYAEQKTYDADPYSEISIANALRMAIAKNGFTTQYQPLFDLDHRTDENYEVIIRVPTESGDMLTERDIREPAANLNLLDEIDLWLLKHSLLQLKERREAGHKTSLFVHQSAVSALNPELPTWIKGQLRELQMVGTGLILDYRLSDLSHDLKQAKRNFYALKKMGIETCISRFSEKPAAFKVLSYLKSNYVSIAPRLLKANKKTIGEIVNQCHKLDTRVIVPNVDDPRSIDLHWSSGADYLQGNFLQRPQDFMDYNFSLVVV